MIDREKSFNYQEYFCPENQNCCLKALSMNEQTYLEGILGPGDSTQKSPL